MTQREALVAADWSRSNHKELVKVLWVTSMSGQHEPITSVTHFDLLKTGSEGLDMMLLVLQHGR